MEKNGEKDARKLLRGMDEIKWLTYLSKMKSIQDDLPSLWKDTETR
jgi:hypothetical protein